MKTLDVPTTNISAPTAYIFGTFSKLQHPSKHELGYSSRFPAVEQVKKEIYDNLSNPDFDLASVIFKPGFDKDYFRRVFKSETGKTPSQYMIDMKIRQAKQLLSDKKMFSIGAISANCGFSDSLYFSTCFKKHVGCSPGEYRRQITQN